MARGLAKERVEGRALLVRRMPYGEADAIVHLFTETHGAVGAIARGARRSRRRFTGLEPMHQLRVTLELSPARELGTLTEAVLLVPRAALTGRLSAMEAAGRALRWLRQAAPPRTPEPALWEEVNGLLDALDRQGASQEATAALATTGLRMLVAAGWALELGRCVRCGKTCPERARTHVDVHAGGVVCRDCGGFGATTSASQRAALQAAMRGEPFAGDAQAAVALVEEAFGVHGRGEAT